MELRMSLDVVVCSLALFHNPSCVNKFIQCIFNVVSTMVMISPMSTWFDCIFVLYYRYSMGLWHIQEGCDASSGSWCPFVICNTCHIIVYYTAWIISIPLWYLPSLFVMIYLRIISTKVTSKILKFINVRIGYW